MPTAPAGDGEQVARVVALEAELEQLRERLAESEQTIQAIRSGEVDAFVVQHSQGEKVFSLRGSEHAYRAIVEQMRDGAITLAEDNTIVFTNRRFLDMLGIPYSKVTGGSLLDHVAPEDVYLTEALLQRARQRESNGEISLIGRDGIRISVHVSAFSVDLEGMAATCVLVMDLTELNRYRYDLEQMVDARTSELLEQNAELRRLSEGKNDLVRRIASEIEKPFMDVEKVVSGLKPSAAELGDGASLPLPKPSLALIEDSVVRLAALLRNVSMLAEIESGNARLEFTSVNLRSLVLDAAEEARGPAGEKGIEILAGVPTDDVSFVGDGRKIRQVIVGLLLVCATSVRRGPIRLTASVTRDLKASFEVCAPGHELPAEDIARMLGGGSSGRR